MKNLPVVIQQKPIQDLRPETILQQVQLSINLLQSIRLIPIIILTFESLTRINIIMRQCTLVYFLVTAEVFIFISYGSCSDNIQSSSHSYLSFQTLLTEFEKCRITYFYTLGAHFEWLNIHNVVQNFDKNLLQIISAHENQPIVGSTSSSFQDTPRFSACAVLVLDGDAKGLSSDLMEIQHDFVWYLHFSLNDEKSSTHMHVNLLDTARAPVVFLHINNFSEIYLVCDPCLRTKSGPSHFPVFYSKVYSDKMSFIASIRNYWIRLNSNVHNQPVAISLGNVGKPELYYHVGQSTPCTRYPKKTREVHHGECIIFLFQNFRNISPQVWKFPAPLRILRTTLSVPIISYTNYANLVPSHNAMYARPYAFILVIDKEILSNLVKMKGILQPLVWWVWIIIVLASVTTSFLFMFSWNIFKEGEITKLWFGFCAIILEQSGSSVRLHETANLRQMLMFFVWCSLCLILSENYKSFLFLTMSVSESPESPQNIEELLARGIVIATTQTLTAGSQAFSGFVNIILDNVIPVMSVNYVVKLYKQLRDTIIWFASSTVVLAYNALVHKQAATSSGQVVQLTETFAILDSETNIREFQKFFEYSGTKFVTRPVTEYTFMAKEYWFSKHNYLFKLFTAFLAQLYESGQFGRWYDFEYDEFANDQGKYLKYWLKYAGFQTNTGSKDEYKIPEEIFLSILVHYGACIGTCMLAFLLEIFNACGRKCRSHQ